MAQIDHRADAVGAQRGGAGIIKRVQDGTASSSDAPRTTDIVEQFAERAWEYAQGKRG